MTIDYEKISDKIQIFMGPDKKYTIGMVENDKMFSKFVLGILNGLPEVNKTFLWESAEEFWRDKIKEELDILLLDINLGGMNGKELLSLYRERNSSTRVVMLSNIQNDDIIIESLKAGADGFILKSEFENISQVINTIMSGGAIITPTIAVRVLHAFRTQKDDNIATLSLRERQVLELLVTGIPTRKAAQTMQISENTLRNHIQSIYKKLNVANKVEMMHRARDMGIF